MDEQFETEVRVYKTAEDYHQDAPKMEAAGWSIADVSERPWRSGCLRILLLGSLGERLFPPKEQIIVSYTRGRL